MPNLTKAEFEAILLADPEHWERVIDPDARETFVPGVSAMADFEAKRGPSVWLNNPPLERDPGRM